MDKFVIRSKKNVITPAAPLESKASSNETTKEIEETLRPHERNNWDRTERTPIKENSENRSNKIIKPTSSSLSKYENVTQKDKTSITISSTGTIKEVQSLKRKTSDNTRDNKKKSDSSLLSANLIQIDTLNSQASSELNISESSDSDDNKGKAAKKKVRRARIFRYQWLDEFNWVENRAGSAFCKVCDTRITNIRSHLVRHNTNATHEKNIEIAKVIPISEYFNTPAKVSLDKQVKEAELMLVMFCIMHHLPFSLMDFLPNLILKCCPDSNVAKHIKCGRTKATCIAKDLLGENGRQNVVNQLQLQKFSIIIDETTDISAAKALAIVARVFDMDRGIIRDRFLGLLKLIKTDAASIYSTIVEYINSLNIPLDNIIGLGSDNASVMSGQFTGVQARLKEVIPNLCFMNCICHSLHLCASNACQKLPYSIEKLARNIFNFFAHSAKRCTDLQEFQDYFTVKPHKILGLAQTRWLSLEAVVNRILEQWDALQLYFLSCALEDKGARDTAKNLAEELSDPSSKSNIFFILILYIADSQ